VFSSTVVFKVVTEGGPTVTAGAGGGPSPPPPQLASNAAANIVAARSHAHPRPSGPFEPLMLCSLAHALSQVARDLDDVRPC
jgi:hypothetical protein